MGVLTHPKRGAETLVNAGRLWTKIVGWPLRAEDRSNRDS